MSKPHDLLLILFCFGLLLTLASPALAQPAPTLVSVNSSSTGSGNRRSGDFGRYRISADGRYAVFYSEASDLVPLDASPNGDIFVRNLQAGTTALVSVNAAGTASGNGISSFGLISADGRYVAFTSFANNIVTNDTNSSPDVFLRDLQAGTTRLISVNAAGTASGTLGGSELIDMSPDGRFITFSSHAQDLTSHTDGNGLGTDIYVRDVVNNKTVLATVNVAGTASGNGSSFGGSISGDGRYVVFTSGSSDLVANDTGTRDAFLRDLQAGTTIRLSTNSAGTAGGNGESFGGLIDRGGRVVVFATQATDLSTLADTNNLADIFIYDVQAGTKSLITVNVAGTATGNGLGDGYFDHGVQYSISDDARFVAFMSQSGNLVVNDTNGNADDIFRYEVATRAKSLVSVNLAGTSGLSGSSSDPSISADGRFVAFDSLANDLVSVADETNGSTTDVFVRDVVVGQTYLASVNSAGSRTGNGFSFQPSISADGRRLVFHSRASDLITNDLNGTAEDVFAFNIVKDDSFTIHLSQSNFTIGEAGGSLAIAVNRTDTTTAATVNYATSDISGLNACSSVTGMASSRCDYATTIGTLRFAQGETSKNIFIPLVDDAWAEGAETFTISLSNPSGVSLGLNSSATIRITDNDSNSNAANPLNQNAFFVRQHYIDFLGREPDSIGYQGWQDILNNCPASGKDSNGNFCDRIEVSSAFFRSEEFQTRAYFVYRFYSAVGRIPLYDGFMPDLAKVSGFLSAQQLEENKVAFVNEFMARPDFQNKYGALSAPTAYVDELLQTVGLPTHPGRQAWITGLTNGSLTRGQVLRALVESGEVYQKYYTEAFVIMQYFGYLRRSADISYLSWIQTMNSNGGDYRVMINGFLNSQEYRQRFGQ